MARHLRANYSLWPERARAGKAVPFTLAFGGFAVGIACALAAYAVFSDITRPSNLAPTYAVATLAKPAVPPAPPPPVDSVAAMAPESSADAAPVEPVNRDSRARLRAAKLTLPIIGTQPVPPAAETEGRGGDEFAKPTTLMPEESGVETQPQPQAVDAALEEAKPAAGEQSDHRRTAARKARSKVAHYREKRVRATRNFASNAHSRSSRGSRSGYSVVSATSSWY